MSSFKKIFRSIKSTLSDADSSTSEISSHTCSSSSSSSGTTDSSISRPRSRSVRESILTYKRSMQAYPEPPPKPPRGRIQPQNFTKHVDEMLKLRPTTSASLRKQESFEFGKEKSDTHYKRLVRKLGKDTSALNQKIEDLSEQLSIYVRNHEKMTTAFIRANTKLREEQKENQLLAAKNELLQKRLDAASKRIGTLERLTALRSHMQKSASVSSESSLDELEEDGFFEDAESSLSETSSFIRQDLRRRPFVLNAAAQSTAVFV
uniref:TACC_C domain-containing protein n=1 Tax=Steinernema glaseri TaxID=37863 RepID=A0A1I7XZ82_9BILA